MAGGREWRVIGNEGRLGVMVELGPSFGSV